MLSVKDHVVVRARVHVQLRMHVCVCVCAQKGQKRMGVQLSVIQWFWFGRPFDLFESASWAVPPSL